MRTVVDCMVFNKFLLIVCRYQVMIECWSDNPKIRPKFSTLRKQFDNILTTQHADVYIDLQTDETSLIYNSHDEVDDTSAFSAKKRTKSPSPAVIACGKSIGTDFLQVHGYYDKGHNQDYI